EVVRRIAEYRPDTDVHEVWRRVVDAADLPHELGDALRDPARVREFVEHGDIGLARMVYSCTQTTFAPTMVHGGVKTNVIPDTVELEVDIRTLPGQRAAEIRDMLAEALGDLAGSVDIQAQSDDEASASPIDTLLWDSIRRVTA